jgi:hypothetical protein
VRERLLDTKVAIDKMTRALVDDDLRDVSDRGQHIAECRPLGLSMGPPVRWIGE